MLSVNEKYFLVGPYGEISDIDIDPIFAKKLSTVVADAISDNPSAFNEDPSGVTTPSDIVPGIFFTEVECGLVMMNESGIILGGYISCDVVIDDPYRGRGLGKELILEYYLRKNEFPTWSLDVAAYSPAGLAAHQAAWRMLSNKKNIEKKLERIDSDYSDCSNLSARRFKP